MLLPLYTTVDHRFGAGSVGQAWFSLLVTCALLLAATEVLFPDTILSVRIAPVPIAAAVHIAGAAAFHFRAAPVMLAYAAFTLWALAMQMHVYWLPYVGVIPHARMVSVTETLGHGYATLLPTFLSGKQFVPPVRATLMAPLYVVSTLASLRTCLAFPDVSPVSALGVTWPVLAALTTRSWALFTSPDGCVICEHKYHFGKSAWQEVHTLALTAGFVVVVALWFGLAVLTRRLTHVEGQEETKKDV